MAARKVSVNEARKQLSHAKNMERVAKGRVRTKSNQLKEAQKRAKSRSIGKKKRKC